MKNVYQLLNLGYELLQRFSKQNNLNIQKTLKTSLHKILEFIQSLRILTSGVMSCSQKTPILHCRFREKL